MIRLAFSPFSLATRRSFVTFSRNAFVRRTFVATPFLKNGTFKEQPILTDPSKGTSNSPQKPQNDKNEVDNVKKVFKPEELESARLARLANLGWLSKLPEKWIPYAELSRLEKPVGSLLLLAPCFWAITMGAYSIAAPITTTVSTIVLFTIGALVMRGAGCTINDILDRNLDNQVARTVERPLASGRVSVPQAVGWLAAQCFAGLAVLLSLPFECFYIGALSLPFVAAYPLFKRFTYYPQVALSITFAWGCLLGFPAVGAPQNLWVVAPLFISKFLWCMIYDTVYAHQDKVYDVKAGIKSTALAWGDMSKPIMYTMGGLQVATFLTAGFMNSMGPFFYLSAAWGFQRLFKQLKTVDLDDPKSCWNVFTGNIRTGYIFWIGMIVDYLLKLAGFL
ncbi:4-hydroxybenzoate_polyprenyl_transferase [Candidozyma auris]|uniref:4-hydroxybenzoate octaprenyltransferase n=1 Tax=Candidozyma auris TaxID=498019 RepID=UPI000D2867E3|nr:4-hydroxybenzoate_polyprenyl_transferase [[Candida] auris]QEO24226.1 4-hydroxybenzoate_polyprenyl_transferase [[Candida] auris]GBL52533.1 putative 4-hydroxybenzoate polyprenyl transferase [[Candida] auris]